MRRQRTRLPDESRNVTIDGAFDSFTPVDSLRLCSTFVFFPTLMIRSTQGVSESFSFHVSLRPAYLTLTIVGGVRSRAISYSRGSVTLPRLPATSFAVKPIV